jgi:hypothetical protein
MVARNVGVLIVWRHQAVNVVACTVGTIAKSLTHTQTHAQGTSKHVNNLRWHDNECTGTCNSPRYKGVGLLLMSDKRTATMHVCHQYELGSHPHLSRPPIFQRVSIALSLFGLIRSAMPVSTTLVSCTYKDIKIFKRVGSCSPTLKSKQRRDTTSGNTTLSIHSIPCTLSGNELDTVTSAIGSQNE